MDNVQIHFQKETARQMIPVLEEKGYVAQYADSAQEARKLALELVPEGATVAVGGSVTLSTLDLIKTFEEGNYNYIDRYHQKDWDDTVQAYRDGLSSDVFVTSVNAITKDGELVVRDCTGNRLSSIVFGPKKVVIIAGVNKVVEDLEEAFSRLEKVAPMNARRLGHVAPCTESGICSDCTVPGRVCNYTGIVHNGRKFPGRIHIILVAEELGY